LPAAFPQYVDINDRVENVIDSNSKKAIAFIKWIIAGSALLIILDLACLLGIVLLVSNGYRPEPQSTLSVALIIVFPAALLLIFLAIFIYAIKRLRGTWALILRKKKVVDDFNTFTFGRVPFSVGPFAKSSTVLGLTHFLEDRLRSTAAMVTDVFLKRIRRLSTDIIIKNPKYKDRVAFNYIYDLDCSISRKKDWKRDGRLRPTKRMSKISLRAERYGTNLWFNGPGGNKYLDNLILCGRMTICLSLLRFIWRKWVIESNKRKKFNKENPGLAPLPSPARPISEESEYYDIYAEILEKWLALKRSDPECEPHKDE
jgi:hypothetical protein